MYEDIVNGFFFASIILCLVMELAVPFKKNWKMGWREISYFPYFFVMGSLINEIFKMILGEQFQRSAWIDETHIGLGIGLGFLFAELGLYWLHRGMHSIPFLWRIHSVHHCEHKLNYLNSFFFHPLEIVIVYFAKFIPMFILGLDASLMGVVFMMSTIISMFSHLNAKVKLGPLRYIIGNPQVHRFHHSIIPEEARNFSVSLPIWDLVFGTFFYKADKTPDKVGLFDHRKPYGILSGLAAPFRPLTSEKNHTSSEVEVDA